MTLESKQTVFSQLGLTFRKVMLLFAGVLLLLASYWIKETLLAEDIKAPKSSIAEPLVEVEQAISRVYGEDQLVKYRLHSATATYLTQGAGTRFTDVSLQIFDEDGVVWRGEAGFIKLSHDMQHLEINDHVSLKQTGNIGKHGALTLTTESLIYDNATSIMVGDNPIRINQGKRMLSSNAFRYDTYSDQLKLLKGVTGFYE